MDDLSFEEFETEYKYLKAVIEGGLEKKPRNVLIYATSNRRHLVRERFSDKEERDEDIHVNDTVQEKLSLSARFGVSIYFGAPDKKEFGDIVKALAARNGITMSEEELLTAAFPAGLPVSSSIICSAYPDKGLHKKGRYVLWLLKHSPQSMWVLLKSQ